MKNIIFSILLLPALTIAQVGINTTTPQETLHVEGTLCVTDVSTKTATKLTGLDENGTLAGITVGTNLDLTGNVLSAKTGTSPSVYLVTTINVQDGPSGDEFHNFDMGVNGVNSDKVVFRLVGRTANFKLTGISGGTDGRHLVIYNVETVNLTFEAESLNSLPQNRLETLANNVATSGKGTAEFVYDGAAQRWILIGFRN